MWVFGYGSLMWDGWEAHHGCLRRVTAELRGYSRTFNKRSVRNWGTRLHPGPTLNLVAGNTSCRGVVFEFPESSRAEIVAYLIRREGTMRAKGSSGSCSDYIKGVADHLQNLGICDPAVADLSSALRKVTRATHWR